VYIKKCARVPCMIVRNEVFPVNTVTAFIQVKIAWKSNIVKVFFSCFNKFLIERQKRKNIL